MNQLVSYCETLFDLQNTVLSDGYYYSSLPLCVIDAVFSIGVNYASASNVVKRYCRNYDLPMFRNRTPEYPDREFQHTTSQLINNIEYGGVEYFARHVCNNLQRTSTRSGILKAEAVYLWVKVFKRYGVEFFQDITKIDEKVEKEILSIKGHGSGLSLSYFRMLSGNDDLCKPDRHLLGFISEALQREIKNISDAQNIMYDAVGILKVTYPNISVRLLDHTIWKYMSEKSKGSRRG